MRTCRRWRVSMAARWSALVSALLMATVGLMLVGERLLPGEHATVAGLVILVMVPLVMVGVRMQLQPELALFRALSGTVISYRDGDYAFGLHWTRNDEAGDLVDAHNELGNVLREQRQGLIQRELLLDTMVQNTPVAMLLVAERGAVVFGNIAARQLLSEGRRLEGHNLDDILRSVASSLRAALDRGGDGLFTVARSAEAGRNNADEDEIYHLARRSFTLNGRRHELLLLRHLTVELRRQEVQTWKKVIRVISHELNNSLAPIASLANSGAELIRRGQPERLPEILATVAARARHLQTFIDGYARFAKLPTPRRAAVMWPQLIAGLKAQVTFVLIGELPDDPVSIDLAQMEQALFNLLRNAHESGSAATDVGLTVRRIPDGVVVEVVDRGSGMTATVMANALVPFYSTKRSGTGLGLALAREIIEAHGGRIGISNRDGGGLAVALVLPA